MTNTRLLADHYKFEKNRSIQSHFCTLSTVEQSLSDRVFRSGLILLRFFFVRFYPFSLEKEMATHSSLPRESRGQRSLVGCSPQGRTKLDTTEAI